MRITSIAVAIAMLTFGSVSMVQAAETFDMLERVQAVPMTVEELSGTVGGIRAIGTALLTPLAVELGDPAAESLFVAAVLVGDGQGS